MATPRERVPRGAGRTALLDSALQLIAERGLHALTMREVANHAGMSLGSTSYHFTDRDHLLEAALQRFADEEIARCEAAVQAWQAEESTPEQLSAMLVDELATSFGRPGSAVPQMELYVEASRNPVLAAAAQRCITAYESMLATALELVGVEPGQAAKRAERMLIYADGVAMHSAASGVPSSFPPDVGKVMWLFATTEV